MIFESVFEGNFEMISDRISERPSRRARHSTPDCSLGGLGGPPGRKIQGLA
jgi:hypothetical protein